MIVAPKIRGFICTTAHPVGCRENVRRQMEYVKAKPETQCGKKALVIGASTGYGLASRITAAFSGRAATIGVIFDKPASGIRTASAGWYNTAAFEEFAAKEGLYAKTINGDAFSQTVKEQVTELIQRDLGQVDLVIYSLAAPRRTMADGTVYSSVLKTAGKNYTDKTIDLKDNSVHPVTISPATPEEIDATVKVMGGGDWLDWIRTLSDAGVLASGAVTTAYSYIGPELTHPIYRDGSIGRAKQDLYDTARKITREFPGVKGYIGVNKALVTQSSAAIPIVPLYISILYKIMKELGLHEGCIEQMYRLYHDKLPAETPLLRLDDWEMREEVQTRVAAAWKEIETDTVAQYADIDGYWLDFYQMFGFRVPGVDYEADVEVGVSIPSLQ